LVIKFQNFNGNFDEVRFREALDEYKNTTDLTEKSIKSLIKLIYAVFDGR